MIDFSLTIDRQSHKTQLRKSLVVDWVGIHWRSIPSIRIWLNPYEIQNLDQTFANLQYKKIITTANLLVVDDCHGGLLWISHRCLVSMVVESDIDRLLIQRATVPMTICRSWRHNAHPRVVQATRIKRKKSCFNEIDACPLSETDRHIGAGANKCMKGWIDQLSTDTKIAEFDFT